MSLDLVNPKTLKLVVAKENLSELFAIKTLEEDEMIGQKTEERMFYSQEFVSF